eukprot:9493875-Pyramimonas_sp.AAC.1
MLTLPPNGKYKPKPNEAHRMQHKTRLTHNLATAVGGHAFLHPQAGHTAISDGAMLRLDGVIKSAYLRLGSASPGH